MSAPEDIFRSIRAYMYEKSTSPLAGSLVLAWIGWNWRVVLTILSSESVEAKFTIIDGLYAAEGSCLTFYVWPILTAFVYIFVFPLPAYIAFYWAKMMQILLNQARQRLEKTELISNEVVEKMRSEWALKEERLGNQINALSDDNERLRSRVEDQIQKTNSQESVSILEGRLSDTDLRVVVTRALADISDDPKKLENLLSKLSSDTEGKIDKKHILDSNEQAYGYYLRHLESSPVSNLENELEISILRAWSSVRKRVNDQISYTNRAKYVAENGDKTKAALRDAIKVLESAVESSADTQA